MFRPWLGNSSPRSPVARNRAKGQRGRGQGVVGLLLRARGRRGPGLGFRGRGCHPCGQRRARVSRPAGNPRTWETHPNLGQPCGFLRKFPPPRILPDYPQGCSVPPDRPVVDAKLLSVNKGKNRQNPDSGHTGRALRLAPLPFPLPAADHAVTRRSLVLPGGAGGAPTFSSLFLRSAHPFPPFIRESFQHCPALL